MHGVIENDGEDGAELAGGGETSIRPIDGGAVHLFVAAHLHAVAVADLDGGPHGVVQWLGGNDLLRNAADVLEGGSPQKPGSACGFRNHHDVLIPYADGVVLKVLGGASGGEVRELDEGLGDVIDGVRENRALSFGVGRRIGEHLRGRRQKENGFVGKGGERVAAVTAGKRGLPLGEPRCGDALGGDHGLQFFGHLAVGLPVRAGKPLAELGDGNQLDLVCRPGR